MDTELKGLQNVLNHISRYLHHANFALSFASIFVNIAHFIVLTRKSMRISSTNVILNGIAISDIFIMFVTIYKNYFMVDVKNPECATSSQRFKIYLDILAWAFQDHFRRCSSWLGVFMAIVRLVIMRRMTDQKGRSWARPQMGYCLMLFVFCVSATMSTFFASRNQVVENGTVPLPLICAEDQDINIRYPFTVTLAPFFSFSDALILRIYVMFDAIVTKFIPCIAFLILTILLIRQLRKLHTVEVLHRRKKSVSNEEKNDLATKLIVVMTVAFFISEAPLGMINVVKVFFDGGDEIFQFSIDIMIYFTFLRTLNSISHSFFCILMSSQYRDTTKRLLGIQRKAKISSARSVVSAVQQIH